MKNAYRGFVLLAEDNPVIAMDIEDFLMRMGAEKVYIADQATRALAILKTENIRYAILDIMLGEEKTFAVADQLICRDIPFIFASGLDRTSTLEGRYPGAGFIEKPYTEQRLLEALKEKLADK